VKTTVDINDALLARAREHARRIGKPLGALVEEGLRRVLEADAFELPDCSVGDPNGDNPLERSTWQDLRDNIYGKR
jgi:hypothetical protein